MLDEIKEEMLKSPDTIIDLLEYFDFAHIKLSYNEIRFARDEYGGKNISIRLNRNEKLYVNDFARGVSKDIFSYIIQEKCVTFRDVIQKTKQILGLDNNWMPRQQCSLFGGIYNNLTKQNKEIILETYGDEVLDQYEKCGNIRFLNDGISLSTQRFWDVRFSIKDNAIIIPVRNEYSELVGVKARVNKEVEDGESKYYYDIPVLMSQVLYGYSENYQYLYGADTVYIGESEKFCQQLHTMGIRNCVSIGSHSLSEKQAKLLLQLSAKSLTFMLDDGLDLSETKRNVDIIKGISSMLQVDMYFFDHTDCLLLNYGDSPSDHGVAIWNEIIENHIRSVDELKGV